MIWDRPRPELIVNGIAAPDLHSFPSGHMAQSTAVYGMIWYFWLRKIRFTGEYLLALTTLILWVGVVAVARLELGAHWLTDIGAGVLVGLVWLAVLITALRRAEAKATAQTPL
jgi:undecaprenyl-diphosphatase